MNIDKQKAIKYFQEQFQNSKGLEISNRLDWLNYCQTVLEGNFQALREFVEAANTFDESLKMFKDKLYSSETQGNIVRHLHNYLVSSKSLVEHTRICMRKWYKNEKILSQYQLKVNESFLNSPLVSFIEALRNYCVHQSPIGVVTQHNLQDSEFPNETYIHKESLLEWSGFPKKAKPYLLNFKEDIHLMKPIYEYHEKVMALKEWLLHEIEVYHSTEINEAKWYVQAIELAEEGDFETIFRTGGIMPFT